MKKRFLALLCVIVLLVTVLPVPARAAAYSGSCGQNVSYHFNSSTGQLSISGSGPMFDSNRNQHPYNGYYWSDFAQEIKKVVISSGVTTVGNGAFFCCGSLESVTLPNTVTQIKDNAFSYCDDLTSITMPSKLTEIGSNAFRETGLSSITIPSSVTTLGARAFAGSRLTSVTVPSGVKTVSDSLFADCAKLKTVTFQGALKNVGVEAFYSCESLTTVKFSGGLTGSIGDHAFAYCDNLTDIAIPEGVTEIHAYAFCDAGKLAEIELPESLTIIADDAFRECASLTSITIPRNVTYIGHGAFYFCDNLEAATMYTETVNQLDELIFERDTVTGLHIIGDAPTIEGEVFGSMGEHFVIYYDEGTSGWVEPTWNGYLIMPWGQTSPSGSGQCGDDVFWTLDNGTLTISGNGATYDYDGSVETAPSWHAYRMYINKVIIEEGVTRVGDYLFSQHESTTSDNYKYLTSVTLPSTVTSIGNNAFYHCTKLTEVNMEEGLLTIGDYAFADCSSLVKFSLPNTLTSFGIRAFYDSFDDIAIVIPSGVSEITDSSFERSNISDITIPESVTVIGPYAFEYCFGLTEIILPESLTTIDHSVFQNCTNLTQITIPAAVTEIGNSAFFSCTGLESVTFEGDAPTLGSNLFYDDVLTVYYPDHNDTWTEEVMQDYSGTVTWVPYHRHDYTGVEPVYDEVNQTHSWACITCGEEKTESCTFEVAVTKEATMHEHGVKEYTCTVCGGSYQTNFLYRISGKGRCETAIAAAEQLKIALGVDSFETIILASGDNFADALSGSYLAAVKGAPILLYRASGMELNLQYIEENLAPGGTVYILGGNSAVPYEVEDALVGYEVVRLSGKTRFDTNLAILEEAGVGNQEILVCTGYNFADSLSASATGLPILMVNNGGGILTMEQIAYLETLEGCSFTVIGGTGAVCEALEIELSGYGEVSRLSGKNREATSVLVAETYFENPDYILLAYSRNFPDGLCGGPLAYALGAPLILSNEGAEAAAAEYVTANGIVNGAVMGGTGALSDVAVEKIFANSVA